MQRARRGDDRQGQQRAGCLAESEAQVEQRFEAELGEHDVVAGLGGAVPGDEHLGSRRLEAHGGQGGDAGRIAVEHHWQAPAGSLDHSPGESRELEPPDGLERGAGVQRDAVELDRS